MSEESDNNIPFIGREIGWDKVVRRAFRVIDFDRNGTVVTPEDQVIPKSDTEPYGFLLVHSPQSKIPAGLPITHKDDFWLVTSVFDDPKFASLLEPPAQVELLVTYAPKTIQENGMAASPQHCLHFALVPNGTMAKYYTSSYSDKGKVKDADNDPVFGKLSYEGYLIVNTVQEPRL